jgi:hypothetical protein
MQEILKVCQIHGNLTHEQVRRDGNKFRCKQCRIKSNKKSYDVNRQNRINNATSWKKQNREHYNAWLREDRKKNPQKYRDYEKKRREIQGAHRNVVEISRRRGITTDQFYEMQQKQNNLCGICNSPETRKSKTEGKITNLCVDHNHKTGKVRMLLCHDCNTGIGKFKDDIKLLESAIEYLKKHNE